MSGLLGPSLTMGKRTFRAEYGSENGLIEIQDFLLTQFESSPWLDYAVSYEVRRMARDLWIRAPK